MNNNRATVPQIRSITEELAGMVRRMRSVSTELQVKRRSNAAAQTTELVILHACEQGKLFNRSYTVNARQHAETVLANREGLSPRQATQAWALMRDLYELLPHSRICVDPDPGQGLEFDQRGVLRKQGKDATGPNAYVSDRIAQFSALVPQAARIDCRKIKTDRLRAFIEVVDADGGLMLATDLYVLNDMIPRLAMDQRDEESSMLRGRLQAWQRTLGVSDPQHMLAILDLLSSFARFGPPDSYALQS